MMLRKTSLQKDDTMSQVPPDSTSDSIISGVVPKCGRRSSFLGTVPSLFIGFNSKSSCLSDTDSVRSPTSPLDYKLFPNLGNSFVRTPPRSPRKSWDCNRVGLGIVDDSDSNLPDSRNIITFGCIPKKRVDALSTPKTCLINCTVITTSSASSPISLPISHVNSPQTFAKSPCSQLGSSHPVPLTAREVGKIQPCSAESHIGGQQGGSGSSSTRGRTQSPTKNQLDPSPPPSSLPISVTCFHEFMTTFSSSEDYTRIICRGPNTKTTHIFGDCILERHACELSTESSKDNRKKKDFLSFCYLCKKKLADGKDIYMYRGDKAFCSCDCRAQKIWIDEVETGNPVMCSSDFPRSDGEDKIKFLCLWISGDMLYGAMVWDPWLIVSQIICLQCMYYVSLGLFMSILVGSRVSRMNLIYLFDYSALTTSTVTGWCVLVSFILSSLAGAGFLLHIINRAKKCLDFAATLYIIHLFICVVYGGWPSSVTWWVVNATGLALMALLGEWLCIRREMQDIPITRLRSSV